MSLRFERQSRGGACAVGWERTLQCTRVKRGGRSVATAALCLTFAAVHLLPSFVPPCTSDSPTSSKLAGIPAEAFIVESKCTPQGHSACICAAYLARATHDAGDVFGVAPPQEHWALG